MEKLAPLSINFTVLSSVRFSLRSCVLMVKIQFSRDKTKSAEMKIDLIKEKSQEEKGKKTIGMTILAHACWFPRNYFCMGGSPESEKSFISFLTA